MELGKNEQKILKFWQENKIFEKLRKKNQGKKRWSFLDGPITANNPMGVHHAWGRTYKDVFQRYKAMQGFDQRWQNGFDCQGLWVEVEVEKELGFKNKKDIEKYGIEKFVEKCKERVKKYSKIQTEQSIRLGQWMDWDNSYYTMSDENNYAIWHFLKKCFQDGLLYKGRDVVPWCWRCGTAISQHEILTEEYQEIVHKAVYVKFPVIGEKDSYFLGWTTTPWTLPGNVALAVHPDLVYAEVKDREGNIFILLKDKADLIGKGEIIKEFRGEKLNGMEYEGLFGEVPVVKEALGRQKHRVILWKEVTPEEGTGVVHIAPGCGQEDFQLAKEHNLPVINPTDDESRYRQGFAELSGKYVFEDKTRDLIFENLTKKDRVLKIEDYSHRYPTCWRCKTGLIFRLVDEWYVKMNPLRESLMAVARKIKWFPFFGLDRELDWLSNMQDWLISKKRYWGLALPIFECKKCGTFEVIGSKEELREKAVASWQEFAGHSPHRPWVDKIKIKCQKCGNLVSRIPDVGNPWLDAGIVPFSTISSIPDKNVNYFTNKKAWQEWFPADFICESFPGQFKNWFYSLLVMSQVLEKTYPCKTVFGYASVVDEKGEEMHKSKGNAIWFDEALEKIGADAMRWMYVRQNPAADLRFGYKAADEVKRKLLTLLNCYTFFETYSNENPKSKIQISNQIQNPKSKNLLDKWIVSKLQGLIEKTTKSLDRYDAARATQAIENFFINDLSLWYIRRSRKRFQEAEASLYFVLLTLAKLTAPFLPFFSEEVYQKLRGDKFPGSVHLCDWPEADKEAIDEKLEKQMDYVREIVAKVLAKRTELGIKVRQPIASLKIKNKKAKIKNELLGLVKEEVNVKKIIFDQKIKEEIWLDAKITQKLKEEGEVREIIRHIQDLRKRAGFSPEHKIVIFCDSEKKLKKLLEKNKKTILSETKAKNLQFAELKEGTSKEITIEGQKMGLSIKKVA